MLNVPYSVYYATKLEHRIWEPIHHQHEAHCWQAPDWKDRKEAFGIVQAEPDDMQANPYRRWCASHNLPLGTDVEDVSKYQYKKALLLTFVIEPVKHIAGTIESIIRLPISLLVSLGACTGKTLCIDRICPMRVKTFLGKVQDTIQSPSNNFHLMIGNIMQTFIMIFPLPCIYSAHAKKIEEGLFRGFYKHFSRELGEMDGSYVSLATCYREFSKSEGKV